MIIEVGKRYWTADHHWVDIDRVLCGDFHGRHQHGFGLWYKADGATGIFTNHRGDLDLISPWEDSKTEDKSESKMDVKEGDNVLVECRVVQVVPHDAVAENCSIRVATLSGGIWIHRSEIKSVEPAPPAVGDTVQWSESYNPTEWIVLGVDGDDLWVKNNEEYRSTGSTKRPGFRVIKRAEPK